MTLYDDLGISKDATEEQIKEAYRNKAKENHPDKGGSSEDMALINKAYKILSNKEKKAHYDKTGNAEQNSFEQKFMAFMNAEFMRAVDMTNNVDNVDLIKPVVNAIHQYIKQKKEYIKGKEVRKLKLEKVIKRLKCKKDNKLVLLVQGHIEDASKEMQLAKNDIDFLKQALEVVKTYYYDYDDTKSDKSTNFFNSSVFEFLNNQAP